MVSFLLIEYFHTYELTIADCIQCLIHCLQDAEVLYELDQIAGLNDIDIRAIQNMWKVLRLGFC